jgi:hypothetical protein
MGKPASLYYNLSTDFIDTINIRSMKILMAVLITAGFTACKKQSNPYSFVPSCIVSKIEELKKNLRQNPPAAVYEYTYFNKKVYYFTADCGDGK